MRFLKTKIYLSRIALEQKLSLQQSCKPASFENNLLPQLLPSNQETSSVPKAIQKKVSIESKPLADTLASKCADTKNISINYGRAIVAFAISSLAKPYLETYFQEDKGLSMSEFIDSMSQIKYQIKGINSLRCLLLVEEKNNVKEAALKRAFQWISQIFIKFFSVNWIMHGKMGHKMTYLKYRSKMLRRVQKPELFTHVRELKKTQRKY